jgi:hypothetical protein
MADLRQRTEIRQADYQAAYPDIERYDPRDDED